MAELSELKTRYTIADAWRDEGLPGEPKQSCRSPFREDRNPSFAIFDDGRKWKDFGTDQGGDVFDLIATARNCTPAEAISIVKGRRGQPVKTKRKPKRIKTLTAPDLRKPTVSELAAILQIRGWSLFAGLEIAHRRGLLFTCTMKDDGAPREAWAITDPSSRAIQVRRIDGQPWTWNKAKAWTLGGSDATWPIGCSAIGERAVVLFCEGGPDFMAAYGLAFEMDQAEQTAAVCMAGASAKISAEALQYFAGKRVRIIEHNDEAGAQAGARWAAQLQASGAIVDGYKCDHPHDDLADLYAAIKPESEALPHELFNEIGGVSCR